MNLITYTSSSKDYGKDITSYYTGHSDTRASQCFSTLVAKLEEKLVSAIWWHRIDFDPRTGEASIVLIDMAKRPLKPVLEINVPTEVEAKVQKTRKFIFEDLEQIQIPDWAAGAQ